MKKKIFDKYLMLEGLSQLKLPGLIFLVVSVLGSGLYAISNYFSYLNYQNQLAVYGNTFSFQNMRIIEIQNVTPLLLPVVFLAPFIFCLMLFSFLNNRKGSDYYHALSCTRICMFLSFTASILIWLVLIIVPTVLIASLIYGVTGAIINAGYIPYLIFTFLAAAVLVTACMLLAMSITGTVFTNTILFGLILFLPRFAIYFLMSNITESVRILPSNAGGLLNIGYNIPVNLIFRTFRSSYNFSMSTLYTSIPPILYTLILAVLYIALACFLFRHRKSETASNSAPNRIMQHIYRCVVTLPIALLIPIILMSYKSTNYQSYSQFLQGQYGTIIALVVISLLIYFLYELLTTKSVKKMFRSAPLLLAVAAFCVLFGVTLNAVKSSLLDFAPSASEIESVTIQPTNNYSSNGSDDSYNSLALNNLSLNNSTIISAVADTLASNVRAIKQSPARPFPEYNANYFVGIKLKNGFYAERILYANSAVNPRLKKAIYTNIPFFNTLTALPDEKSVDIISTSKDPYSFSDQMSIQLWKCFKAEYATLSYSEKLSADLNATYYSTNYPILNVYGSYGINRYNCNYVLNNKLPKTQALYAELLNAHNKLKARTVLSAYIKNPKGRTFPNVILFNCKKAGLPPTASGTFSLNSLIRNISTDQEIKACRILQQTFNEPIDVTQPYICVSVYSKNNTVNYYQAITLDNVKKIKALLSVQKK